MQPPSQHNLLFYLGKGMLLRGVVFTIRHKKCQLELGHLSETSLTVMKEAVGDYNLNDQTNQDKVMPAHVSPSK